MSSYQYSWMTYRAKDGEEIRIFNFTSIPPLTAHNIAKKMYTFVYNEPEVDREAKMKSGDYFFRKLTPKEAREFAQEKTQTFTEKWEEENDQKASSRGKKKIKARFEVDFLNMGVVCKVE